MLASSSYAGVVLLVLGGLLVVTAGGALYLRNRSRRSGPDIPGGMRPGPSDSALETPLLQKLQGWSVVLLMFFVLWIPYIWLREPSVNLQQEKDLKTTAIERGHLATQLYSEDNQLGVGCVRCHGPALSGGVVQAGDGYAYPPNLQTMCAGPFADPPHSAIMSLDDIYQVIEEGRNVMPSWSIRFQGALNDQQINDLVNYLVFMSSQHVPYKDNVCINPDASKRAIALNAASAAPLDERDP